MTRAVRLCVPVSLLCAFVSLTAFAAGGDQLGKGVSLPEATPIKSLYDAPEKFTGKAVRVDGVVSAVCEAMGCWMALADPDHADLVVRFKVDHGAGIVFPLAAKGKPASAQGVFEAIADAEGREAATEHAAGSSNSAAFGARYHIKATGAVIK